MKVKMTDALTTLYPLTTVCPTTVILTYICTYKSMRVSNKTLNK